MKILLLEDDASLADIMQDYLREFYEVAHAYSIQNARELIEADSFDIYVFDINLPDGDSLKLLKEQRAFFDTTPTIFITAFEDIKYLKQAFSNGANDFIKKPFELEELKERIENLKRFFGLGELLVLGEGIRLHVKEKKLITPQQNLQLGNKEFGVLSYLFKHKNRIVGMDELLQNVWSYEELPTNDALRTLIKELRKHIGSEHIVNIRGEGYRFE